MTSTLISLLLIVFLMVQSLKSFVDTAPAPTSLLGSQEVVPQYQDSDVRDLENLKGKSIAMMKTHSEVYSNINGLQEAHSDTKEQLHENGKLVASLGQRLDELPGPDGSPTGKLQTKLDIPSEGIHKNSVQQIPAQQLNQAPSAPVGTAVATDNGNRRATNLEVLQEPNNSDKDGSYSGIQYSPLDMAEYVFWTGDEKGVTLAIEEFLQEGLMSREEAISFLQDIKYNLDYLQKHYTEVGLNTRERAREKESTPNGLFYNNVRETGNKLQKINPYNSNQMKTESKKKSNVAWTNFIKEQTKLDQNSALLKQSEQYDELLERLRVADFLYTEYSLEEVIYQLAKVMFTQSLTRGSLEAQQSLQKFTSFLEIEAEQGRISRALEKRVLDVLIASLTDTVNDQPEVAINNQDGINLSEPASKQNLMKEILKLNSGNNKIMNDILTPNFGDILRTSKIIPLRDQMDSSNQHLSLDLEKYKHL